MSASGNSYCRLCAQLKPQKKLIDLNTNEKNLEEIVNKLIRLNCFFDYKQSNLPKTVCLVCINSLNTAFDFVQAFDHAQIILKDLITSQTDKDEFEESGTIHEYSSDECYKDDIKIEIELIEENAAKSTNNKDIPVEVKTPNDISDDTQVSKGNLTWRDYYWMCSYCETQFPTQTELKNHSMEYHKSCSAYRCTECKIKKSQLDTFISHVCKHRDYLRTSCYKCFNIFPSTHVTYKHKAVHITSDFKCNGCNTCFTSGELLNNHVKMYFKNARSEIKQPQAQKDNLSCPVCRKTFKALLNLNKHMLIHTDRKRDHTCEICGKCYFNIRSLAKHVKLHEDVRPFQCEICKFSFKTKEQLRKHIGVHDNEKPFACQQCGKVFRLEKQLKLHSIIHTDSFPHICSYCNKGFRFKSTLSCHLNQHTGMKPYRCVVCEREFTNWSNYNKHMKCRHRMDMAKKKHTPNGLYRVDPATGKVIYPEMDKMLEFRTKILEKKTSDRSKVENKKV